jgi:uncharacterized LabA/DUF88 family protein
MENFRFKLKGKTLVIVDWANVYGWREKLKWEIDPESLYRYLEEYKEIYDIRFYFGVEKGIKKSETFHKKIKKIGYTVVSKEVKWVPVTIGKEHFRKSIRNLFKKYGFKEEFFEEFFEKLKKDKDLKRRKCDFDVEITKDIILNLDKFQSLILFSGDGDYKAIVEYLLDIGKQVVVVHPFGLRGKEYNELLKRKRNRPYFCAVDKWLKFFIKKSPGR